MENKLNNKLEIKIKMLRQKTQLSQDKLAKKSNVVYTTLTKIETGVIKNLSVFVVEKIAKGLNVSIKDLL